MSQQTDGYVTRRSARLAGKPSTPVPPLFSPTRRSSRLKRNTSVETVDEEPSARSNASKRLSFTDVAESPKNSQTGTPKSVGKSPKKSQDKTPGVKITGESSNRNSGKRSTTFSSPTRQSPRLRRNVSVEILDDEPSAQSNAFKRLSFADVAESPKNSKAVTPKSPVKIQNLVDDEPPRAIVSSDEEEPSQQSNASKRLSFGDVAESAKTSQARTPKSLSKVQNLDNDEPPRAIESSSEEEVEKSNTSKKLSLSDDVTSLRKSQDKTPEVKITGESSNRNSGKRSTTFSSPTRQSPRLRRNVSVEILDDEPSAQSNAFKRLSFADVAESPKNSKAVTPKSPVKVQNLVDDEPPRAIVSSDEEEPSQQSNASKRLSFGDVAESAKTSQARTPKSLSKVQNLDNDEPLRAIESSSEEEVEKSNTSKKLSLSDDVMSLRKSQDKTPEVKITDESATGNSEKRSTTFPSPTRRSSRLRRNDSVEILDDEPSAQSNASKRLSFADVAESPKNSQAVTHKSPVKVQSHDNDEPPSVVESSDEEEPSPQSKASKRFSFTDTVGSPKKSQTGTPQSMGKSPKEVQNVDDDDEPPNTIESSDEEPLEKSNTSKKLSPKKSQDMTPEVKTTNESADRSSGKRSTTFPSPTRQSPRLRQSVSVEILDDEPSAQSNASKRLSFADVAESPKNSQAGTPKALRKSLFKAQNVDKNESPRTVESSDEEESSQQSNASNRFSFTDMINSPKKSQTGTPKSPSKVENLDNDELPRDFESSDEEVEKSIISKKLSFPSTATSPKKSLDKTFLSPTRRSSRLKQSDSEEILDDELFHQSNASKRISFSDTVDSLKKSQNGTPKSPVKIQSLDNDEPQSAVESSDEEEPSQQSKSSVSKRLSFADTVDSPKKSQTETLQSMGKSPKEVQNVDDDDESPKTIESSDEEALEKSNTSKKLSFSNAVKSTDGSATRNSEKRSTAFPSPTRRNDSVEIHDDEPSAPSNASKRLSLADVAEPPRNSHSGTPKAVRKSLSIAQNVDNNESPRTVESSDKKEPSQQNFRIENAATFFKNRGKNSANMLKNLRQSYSALNDLSFAASPLVSEELIVKDETDNELIWQQISMQNKAVFKEVKKTLKLLGDDLKIPEEGGSDDSEVEDNQMVDEEEFEDDDDEFEEIEEDEPPRKKTKGVDLFNIRPQDLKNLDSKLKALDDDEDDDEEEAEDHEMDDEEEEEEEISAPPPKKGKKSAVDDKFFSLSEMEKFLNEQETNGQMSDIDDDGDDEDFETDYRYKDFFEESAPKKKNGKKVRFQEDDAEDKEVDVDQDMEEYEDEDDEEEAEENGTAPVLLGSKKEVSKPSSSHEMSREKMLKLIDKIQSENLNPRSWELSGEVKADDREVNSLLQKYVEADFRKKQPPINSKEKSDKIYSICLRRFKDKLFDDVTRKYRDDDTVQAYRNLTVDMNERKSLMDVYEDKYQAAQNGESGSTEDIDPQVKDIQKNMNELFYKLDALSHLQFAPSRISEEIRMVKNMPSMRVEEVGPMAAAAADETLLAPEEISRHVKKAPKSKDERTETDKNQERRKKKRKQSDMAKSGKMPKVGKDKEEAAPSTSKSSKKGKGKDFFAELQNVASREIKEKKEKADVSSKKKKKPKDKSETAAKYKA